MDSLLFLCARRVVAQHPLPALPPHLYPVLFQVAFQDGSALALWDLVATWPFPELHLQQLLGHLEPRWDDPDIGCVEDVIQGVVAQLWQELDEPSPQSRFRLRVLDITGVSDDPEESWFCSNTEDLAKACVEVSKHQQEFQRLQHPGVDIHADLRVSKNSYEILRDALQTGATGLLRLKCREFQAQNISASEVVTLLESLDPSCLRRVELCCCYGFPELLLILPHLSHFPELRSLKLQDINVDVQDPTPESANGIRDVARQLGMLPILRELKLGFTWISGNLSQILRNLQAPLESLDLGYSFLLPADLTFLSQSIHALALKRLDLSGHVISQGLLEPLRLLLEETSASLLYLNLTYCDMADSHLAALLPTLLRCSRLRFLGLHINPLSKAAIKDLLQKTLELPDLHLVVYPVPLDCYTQDPSEFDWHFADRSVDEELLSAAKAEISQLLENCGRTDLVWTDDPDSHKALDYFSL